MEVTGFKLRNSYQTFYVETNNLFVKRNTMCLAETEHGIDIGRVSRGSRIVRDEEIEVKGKLLKITSQDDLKVLPEIISIEERAFKICKEKAKEKKLDMKLVSVKCLFDKTKILFYFVADNRIDFRELVRDLASIFRTRIEMRQIGVRDEARIVGGFGPCGRQLCCIDLKEEFDPVSIKMAKEQNLNLNSLKISGMCGRLQCCIGHEYDTYKDLNEDMPRVGSKIKIADKVYTVETLEPLKRTCRLKCGDHVIDVCQNDIEKKDGGYNFSRSILESVEKFFQNSSEEE